MTVSRPRGVGLAYELTKKQTVSAELEVEYSRITDAFVTDKDHLIVSTPLQYVYDNRDDKLNPTKGFRLFGYVEPAYDTQQRDDLRQGQGRGSVYQAFDSAESSCWRAVLAAGSIVGAEFAGYPGGPAVLCGRRRFGARLCLSGDWSKDATTSRPAGCRFVEGSAELRFEVTDTIRHRSLHRCGNGFGGGISGFCRPQGWCGRGYPLSDAIRSAAGRCSRSAQQGARMIPISAFMPASVRRSER